MTAWVIPIGAAFPEHWTIAREHGAWDLTRRAAIEPSDDVFFWLGGASALAWVRATSSAICARIQKNLHLEGSARAEKPRAPAIRRANHHGAVEEGVVVLAACLG